MDSVREAWTAAYNLYSEYAQPMKEAVASRNRVALETLWESVGNFLSVQGNKLDREGRDIIIAAYGLLETACKRAEEKKQ